MPEDRSPDDAPSGGRTESHELFRTDDAPPSAARPGASGSAAPRPATAVRRLADGNRHLILGYVPLALIAAAILLMVAIIPSRVPDDDAPSAAAIPVATVPATTVAPTAAAAATAAAATTAAPAAAATVAVTTPTAATDSPDDAGVADTSAATNASAAAEVPLATAAGNPNDPVPDAFGNSGLPASGWGDTVTACADRDIQVLSTYTPPCFEFAGDNGGATTFGVTADSINVSYRFLADGHLLGTLGALAGNVIDEDAEDVWRTTEALVEYFNANYQMYGRQIVLNRFDGAGSLLAEVTGGGIEQATSDALAAYDSQAFADVGNGMTSTQPYAEALTSAGILSFGVGYMSQEWFTARGPYAWSVFPDCSLVADTAADVAIQRLMPEPAALAEGALNGQPRTLGIVHPNNLEYTQCADHFVARMEEAGMPVALRQNYTLDLGATATNAASILARLKDANITSVGCACDPLMMKALVAAAEQQGYSPEWFIVGVGYIDLDLVGQMIAAGAGDQWSHSLGGSHFAVPQPFGQSEGYYAYKTVRDDEPSVTIDLIYAQLLRLVIGIQMAGPDLTPQTFEAGMYNYPERTGAGGTWDFSPENHSGVVDARLVFWDPNAPSPFNGQPGTYVDTGQRFRDASDAPTQDELLALAESLGLVLPGPAS